VGYVGTLTGWHGINLLYEAGQLLKKRGLPVVFLVIGGDPAKVKTHRVKVAEHNLQDGLRFAGSVSYQDVPHYISSLDVCLIPNSHHWASPTKMFEYQAMGKPVVAPRLIPIEDAMTHQQEGLLFEPESVKGMVELIEVLLKNPEMRKEMGQRARSRVIKNHAWENNVNRIIDVFELMLEEKKKKYAF
jgi:glycosyltransferase involved in cell wall biosynthesis